MLQNVALENVENHGCESITCQMKEFFPSSSRITNRYGRRQRPDLEIGLRKTTHVDTSSQKALLQESDEE